MSRKPSPQSLGKKAQFESTSYNRQKEKEADQQDKNSSTNPSKKIIDNSGQFSLENNNTSIRESQAHRDGDSEIQGPIINTKTTLIMVESTPNTSEASLIFPLVQNLLETQENKMNAELENFSTQEFGRCPPYEALVMIPPAKQYNTRWKKRARNSALPTRDLNLSTSLDRERECLISNQRSPLAWKMQI